MDSDGAKRRRVATGEPFPSNIVRNLVPRESTVLGSLPAEIVLDILEELETPDLKAFALASRWAHNLSKELSWKRVDLTSANIVFLLTNRGFQTRVREVTWHADLAVAMHGPTNVGTTVSLLTNLPDLRVLKIEGVRNIRAARALFRFFRLLPVIETIRRIEIRIGVQSNTGLHRLSTVADPDWATVNLATQPGLKAISLEFGPWAMGLTRIDTFTLAVVKPHLETLKRLEVKCIIQRLAQYDIPARLKHHPFRIAPEDLAIAGAAANQVSIQKGMQKAHLDEFSSETLEVFKFYNECSLGGDITLEEVCGVWPQLHELDFITAEAWNKSLKEFKLERNLWKLTILRLPGGSLFTENAGVPLIDFASKAHFNGPGSANNIEEQLVSNGFPNLKHICWYNRLVNSYEGNTPGVRVTSIVIKGMVGDRSLNYDTASR
ncbi:hypothetical protein H072_6680 [Dactylellina haptotyla CBS 200.50]|uniref:F-box domain-containing protein n=1 Tax=Dactylellina haptotyla (strain CBS 200.50) TaxID=1284197 RepID=S8BJS1_DACHA|nr:hypothetical protein H072_6680 [Dactylellina haptotyla CBS 200.50]